METVPGAQNRIVTLSGLKLNGLVLVLTIPLWFFVSGTYVAAFGYTDYLMGVRDVLNIKVFVLLFLGIPVHELLHALTWMILQKEGFKNIQFGFNWESLTPYTHYKQPMIMWKYRWGGAVPGLLMGLLPIILSFILKYPELNFIGFLFTWAALGDAISLFMTRKFKGNQVVKDHPTEMGIALVE